MCHTAVSDVLSGTKLCRKARGPSLQVPVWGISVLSEIAAESAEGKQSAEGVNSKGNKRKRRQGSGAKLFAAKKAEEAGEEHAGIAVEEGGEEGDDIQAGDTGEVLEGTEMRYSLGGIIHPHLHRNKA